MPGHSWSGLEREVKSEVKKFDNVKFMQNIKEGI